jgi:6-pyruvoyltetrahydropterin/6-carboxytetrahydropterin synthase
MMLVTRVERIEAVAPGEGGRFRVFAFDLEATVEGAVDPRHGMVINIIDMKKELRQDVIRIVQGACLDGRGATPPCPTAGALAQGIWRLLGGELGGRPLYRIRLVGHSSPILEYRGGENPRMDVTRVYEFSASHRLHSPALSEEENARLFGKCNNRKGHGHNYVLEVTLRGAPPPDGELLSAEEFDALVEGAVVDRWDHKNLNEDLAEFEGINPTAEEIVRVAWRKIGKVLEGLQTPARLYRIKLRETPRNHVEYFGD